MYRGIFVEELYQLISICVKKQKGEKKNLFGGMQRACPGSQEDQKARVKVVNGFKGIQMTSA